jgi:1-acyl-sn-glycerol-3-phosphate acyltransferase
MILNKIRFFITVFQLAFTVSILIILMYIFNNKNKSLRQIWAKFQMKLLGIKINIIGTIDHSANMIIINHQSLLDIVIFEYLHPKDIAWIAKKEIANLFWFVNILKVPNMIIVQRESKSSLVQLLKDAKEKFQQHRPIAIFPEGTRTDGKKLRKFKAGAKMIALKNKFKVQPIVIVGTRDILDSHNFIHKNGTVDIIYLPSINAQKNTNWYEQMEEDMGKVLSKKLKENQYEL